MYCTASLISSLSTLNKPSVPADRPFTTHGLLVLSVPSEATRPLGVGGRIARLRKSTSQSKLVLVALSLGARCRRALWKRKKTCPHGVGAASASVQRSLNDSLATAVAHIGRAPSPCSLDGSSPPSQTLLSYASSLTNSVSYSESPRMSSSSSLSSGLSFWCRGPDGSLGTTCPLGQLPQATPPSTP